jgi:hypothetical protein
VPPLRAALGAEVLAEERVAEVGVVVVVVASPLVVVVEVEGAEGRLVEDEFDLLRGLLARCFSARNALAYLEGVPPRCGYP